MNLTKKLMAGVIASALLMAATGCDEPKQDSQKKTDCNQIEKNGETTTTQNPSSTECHRPGTYHGTTTHMTSPPHEAGGGTTSNKENEEAGKSKSGTTSEGEGTSKSGSSSESVGGKTSIAGSGFEGGGRSVSGFGSGAHGESGGG